jgi:DNA polymerase-4/DNA polymerase V
MCPDLVVLPSDYETYSLFSKRMFEIVRRYTPWVEEYSIDEGFAELTGMRRLFRCGYEDITRRIQEEIQATLDITVSVGLGCSKSLAKLASKYRKPRGLTAVPGRRIPEFLRSRTLSDVWGFGPSTVALLSRQGLTTPWDFVQQPESWAGRLLGKVGRELWNELRGTPVFPIRTEEEGPPASISKCKTFTSPSSDPDFIYAKLVRNAESAFIKLRRHRLRVRRIAVSLRRQDYEQQGLETRLSRGTASVQETLPCVREIFDALYVPRTPYRATQIVLFDVESDASDQLELFEDRLKIDRLQEVSRVTDAVNARYGKHKIGTGQALFLDQHPRTDRDEQPARKKELLPGETARRRVGLPRLDIVV